MKRKIIGITGGIGAGKSTVLQLLKEHFPAVILQTDEVAKELMRAGQPGFQRVVDFFGPEIVAADGEINRPALSAIVFHHPGKLAVLNSLIHPLVKNEVIRQINLFKANPAAGSAFFVESALLLEDHYEVFCDEIWYIYAEETVRKARLMESRGLSAEKAAAIMASQMTDAEFRKRCTHCIDNGKSINFTLSQLENLLRV